MKLPHLDQLVPLERGEAGLLARAVAVLVRDVTHSTSAHTKETMLCFGPLAALTMKLYRCHQREQLVPLRPGRRPKPRLFRLSYDQLISLMINRASLFYCGLSDIENLQLRVLLDKVQQASLNLECYVRFSS